MDREGQKMRLLTAEEVAEKLRVKVSFVKDRTRTRCPEEDRIPCVRLGRWIRFSEQYVNEWMARGCKTPKAMK
jgi:excisionase family DNA binding protein